MSDHGNRRQRQLRARLGESLKGLAGGMVRSMGVPTQRIALPGSDDAISQRYARSVIELCLRVGETMIATGASAADTVAQVLRLSSSFGISGVHVDIHFSSITVSVHRGLDEDPITVMRVVKVRTTDYTRLRDVYRLMDEITSSNDPVDPDVARRHLSEILQQPHPYRRWMMSLGKAVLAAGVVVMYDASFVVIVAAALSAILADIVTRRLDKWGISAFFVQMAAAVVITSIAALLYWVQKLGFDFMAQVQPTVIVISGIMLLLSGIGLTAAARDAIDGYYITASSRGLEVIMMTLGLAVGISLTIGVAIRLGIPIDVGTSLGRTENMWAGVLGAALIGVGFTLTSYVRLIIAPVMAVLAGAVFAVYFIIQPLLEGPGLAPGIAGIAAGVLSYLVYRWIMVPEAALTMAAIIGLIPGLTVYRGLYTLMDGPQGIVAALGELFTALAVGIGLAAGTTIGGQLARRSFGLDRAAEISLRRSRRVK
ncbi:threonine/serine exporter ThrE family protein [Microbacterium sp. MPKO10]|uniref:threonine/serine ThrE exporter family protein n=1 Tax=Microbacterium sp. MPKO10 TaxID=2989818 RepID=UPI002236A686|nr:threonine/serine exporter family protein [Microbacterium sp. MPKO10]MCW4456888.1 threonine/serine exporter family protein [Microbacterium sp. MPKO10]